MPVSNEPAVPVSHPMVCPHNIVRTRSQPAAKPRAAARARRPLALAALLAAVGLLLSTVLGSSDATLTRVSVNPGNAFSAGVSSHVNSKNGAMVISAAGLMPGGSASGTLTITVQGDYPAVVTLANAGISDQPASPALSQALTLKVEDITGTLQTLWNGTMSNFSSLSLGQIASGTTKTYRFTITFATGSAVPGLQNASTAMTIRFTGVAQ